MRSLDWLFFVAPLLFVLWAGWLTRRYMKSVADFLSGGRLAERYLLAVAQGELQSGAVVFIAVFEVMAHSGFTLQWWTWMQAPFALIVTISGFVIYRYRETRAMTLAQFFEIRYSKSFRVFTGILAFIAGILNFGIIPSVGARFVVYFLGLPQSIIVFSVTIPTYIPIMGLLLAVTLFVTLSGGLITVMITDCVEGMISQIGYLVIIFSLLLTFKWSQISETLGHRPAGQSLLNPFDSQGIQDFNLWYVVMAMCISVYGTMAWQNASAYKSAAISPHESRMGSILGRWRELGKVAFCAMLAVCAITYLSHPDFAGMSLQAHQEIGQIQDPQIQQQMTVPIALSHLLPMGVKGLFCAILLMGIFGGDSTHLHSWGGIFVQDIIVPLRRKPLAPDQHIRLLRYAIIGVAGFAFLFGSLFRQTEYIVMWWQITTAIYVGGAGVAIIGGLYWKKGTTAAAWAALLTGSALSVGGICARGILGSTFPLNGLEVSFAAALIAIAIYFVTSLLTSKEDFSMDRMLHRGKYALVLPDQCQAPSPPQPKGRLTWGNLIGIDRHFSLSDKWIAGGLFAWSMLWFIIAIFGSFWNLFSPWSVADWSSFWHVAGIGIPTLVAIVASVWFTWGGIRDIGRLFRRLTQEKVNQQDDGTVVGHLNRDEVLPAPKSEAP